MSDPKPKLTLRQEAAIQALLACETQEDAAEEAGINVSTLRRWQRNPVFQEAYCQARRRLWEAGMEALLKLNAKAVRTLDRAMDCELPNVRVRAALGVLRLIYRDKDLELEERLSTLEETRHERSLS